MTAAAFQSTVFLQQGFGVPGQVFDSSPRRSQPWILNSALATYNIFGRAFTVVSQGIAQAGNPSAGTYAGVLINPREYASFGDGTNPLNPSLQLPNGEVAELLTMGSVIVTLPNSANIGDVIIYDNTTGILASIAPTVSLPSGKSYAYAYVSRFTQGGSSGLAVIEVNSVTPAVIQ